MTSTIELHPEILVTGATGFVGRWLLAALTRRGDRVAALVRGAAAREAELRAFVGRLGGDPTRLAVVEGDVERADLGLAHPLPEVRVVHHLAARFAFGLSRDDARRANVLGTEHVMRWAAAQPRLDRFVFLGGYRMTALDTSALDERALERHYAAGAYEGSKVEAYLAFRRLARELDLPWTAVHPSGVIGDSRTGETTQIVGLGDTVRRLFEGRLPALAGSARTFVPVVTVDYLADYLATVSARAETAGQQLVVLDPASPALPELVLRLAAVLGVRPPTRTLPVGLVSALPRAWTGLDAESASFLSEDRYDTRAGDAHARAVGLSHPPLDQALARWCAYLVSTRFLEAPRSEIGAFHEGSFVVGDPGTADVVMLHGIPFDGDALIPLSHALEPRTTARLDLPGLGRSGAGTIDDAWLERMLRGRSRPVTLVGHSLGAALAARYAAAHPERVAALVLVAPAFLAAPGSWTLALRPLVGAILGGLDEASFERRFLAERAPGPTLPATRSAMAGLARVGGARRHADALADALASRGLALEAYRALCAHGIPVSVVHAASEPPVEDVRGAGVTCIAGAGHNPHLTHTEEVARSVRTWLSEPQNVRGNRSWSGMAMRAPQAAAS